MHTNTRTMSTLHESAVQDPLARLSPRERQVFDLIAIGVKPSVIGPRMGISVKTVATVRVRIFHKLAIKTNADIVHLHIGEALLAAKDHTLIAAAMTAGVATWKPFDLLGAGEICVAGLRYVAHLDAAGVPELHDHVRRALTAALEWERTQKERAA